MAIAASVGIKHPSGVPLDALLRHRVKRAPGGDGHGDAETLRDALLDLPRVEHVRNFRGRVVVDEEIDIVVGPLAAASPRSKNI